MLSDYVYRHSDILVGAMREERGSSQVQRVLFSIIVLTFRRDDVLEEQFTRLVTLAKKSPSVEILLVDNNADEEDRSKYLKGLDYGRILRPEKNLGVAGGRNLGITQARGEYLIFIDDDAIFDSNFQGFDVISKEFDEDPTLGVIAFRSTSFQSGMTLPKEFPHTNKKRSKLQRFYTFRYIGVGHAIRASALRVTGLYEEDFFYGMEEFDLAFRMIKSNFKILYFPGVQVIHKHHHSGRVTNLEGWTYALLNKMKVGYLHLPWYYFCVNLLVWNCFVVLIARSLLPLRKAWAEFFFWRKRTERRRQVLSKDALRYVKVCSGNLFK